MLDLLVEMVMRLNGKRSACGRWTFEEKGTFVAAGVPAQRPVPLDRAPDHWGRLAALYLAFVKHRHALVHRRTQVAHDGALHATDRAGRPLTPIAADEQDAFVRLAEQVASAVVAGADNARLANRIAWELDALTSHHGQPSLSAQRPANVIRKVVVNLEALDGGRWRLDGGRVHENLRTQQASPSTPTWRPRASRRGRSDLRRALRRRARGVDHLRRRCAAAMAAAPRACGHTVSVGAYPPRKLRWLGRYCLERRDVTLAQVREAADAFVRLAEGRDGAEATLRRLSTP